jgi:hypothetical protein
MAKKAPIVENKKLYTPAEANAALPLVRSILRDIAELTRDLRERHERLTRIKPPQSGRLGEAHEEELSKVREEFERDQERMRDYIDELEKLGVELKDPDTGLVDFRCRMQGREVYLCWRLGEDEVGHWHELNAGFTGRKRLAKEPAAI